ncbi:hypothetical protein CPC08DRAFT_678513 [Agrocybe pediades]|nr:hypothetical protein CPC08DRAFT_678513 [Agrocybe pediades]
MQSIALKRQAIKRTVQSTLASSAYAYRCASTSSTSLLTPGRSVVCRRCIQKGLSLSPPKSIPSQSVSGQIFTATVSVKLTRTFATSSSCFASSSTSNAEEGLDAPPNLVFADPHRPDLFYHLVPPPTPLSRKHPAYALSFLGEEDLKSGINLGGVGDGRSPAVIGWLPAAQEGDGKETTLSDFVQNDNFIRFMHDTIKDVLEKGEDDIWTTGAMQLQHGWMHIHDQRNVPALGRIGDPDDIIASVLVEDSKIKAETYQAMPSYRVCTADGIVQLTEGIATRLKERLLAAVL